MPPERRSSLEEATELPEDLVERLYLYAGLGAGEDLPVRAGRSGPGQWKRFPAATAAAIA